MPTVFGLGLCCVGRLREVEEEKVRRHTENRVIGTGALLISIVTFVGAVSGHRHATWVWLAGATVLVSTIVASLAIRFMGRRR